MEAGHSEERCYAYGTCNSTEPVPVQKCKRKSIHTTTTVRTSFFLVFFNIIINIIHCVVQYYNVIIL